MSKQAFASSIISRVRSAIGTNGGSYTASTASSAMNAVVAAISEYLIANTTVTIAYEGVMTSNGAPDPNDSDTFKIVGSCATPGPSNSFDAWMALLQANIIAGFSLAPAGDDYGTVFVMKPFLIPGVGISRSDLTAAHNVRDDNPQQQIWEIVCGAIMDWINGSALNPTPSAATRAESAGVANIVNITIT